jgi:Tol biopolymer transport system component
MRAGKPFARTIEEERHLADVRQLTFGGENAEAYFSPDGRQLVFQATVAPAKCDQQFVMDLETGETRRISDGEGRTTCGYFDWPEADRIVYASTASEGADCPAPPDRSRGYVWAVHKSFELYEVPPAGGTPRRLTENRAYDAEATWCHRGGRLVFTSDRDGDLDLYEMDEAGGVRRLTREPGYDGGAVYSPDCSEIAWRASRPKGADLEEYRSLLAQGLVRPGALEIFVMGADGSEARAVTSNGAANFGPTFHPDGNRILYSSNVGASAREFELWIVDKRDGKSERVTHAPGFDGFPEFSPDGRYLIWASNRSNPEGRETNLFIARWVP